MNPKIWLSSPHMGETEQRYVQEAFATNWIAPWGRMWTVSRGIWSPIAGWTMRRR